MRGRIVAAGVSVAAAGSLVGVMAARDHTADASTPTTPAAVPSATPSSGTSSATPYDPYDGQATTGASGYQPQPQTRTGGS
jgi:hypothetical protein